MAVSNTDCSSGVGSMGHNACRYCTVAGHYSMSSQPAAPYRNQCFLDPLESGKVMSSVYTAMMV